MRGLRALSLSLALSLLLLTGGCGEEPAPGAAESAASSGDAEVSSPPSSAVEASPAQEAFSAAEPSSAAEKSAPPQEPEEGEAVIVCFSYTGNTEALARVLAAQTGAELVLLVPAEPYPDDYDATLSQAWEERENDARPAYEGTIDVSGYDTVYLGSPVWWDDLPMLVRTFLDGAELSGKTVAPFFTSGSGDAEAAYETLCGAVADAAVTQPLSLRSEQVEEAERFAAEWLSALEAETS